MADFECIIAEEERKKAKEERKKAEEDEQNNKSIKIDILLLLHKINTTLKDIKQNFTFQKPLKYLVIKDYNATIENDHTYVSIENNNTSIIIAILKNRITNHKIETDLIKNLNNLLAYLKNYNIIYIPSQRSFILPIEDIIGTNFGIRLNGSDGTYFKYIDDDKTITTNNIQISLKT